MKIDEIISSLTSDGIVLGLKRIEELLDKMGNPQKYLKIIHVAGTNGKGSTCSMISSVLIKSGYKTGLFTSPFIETRNEEIQINSMHITDERLISLLESIKPIVDTMKNKPSEFELKTALAFLYFKEENCDVVVLEVGLGGRLDATNIITKPILSVITKIAIDHTTFLGDTIEHIAIEKSGIIKDNCSCVVMSQDKKILRVFEDVCSKKNAAFILSDTDLATVNQISLNGISLNYKDFINLEIPLIGTHQVDNASLVLKAIEVLKENGFTISDKDIYEGLKNTKWKGRFEVLSHKPLFIIDGAHNLDGVNAFISTLKEVLANQKCTFIMGMMKDKEHKKMIKKLLPFADVFIAAAVNLPRALPAHELAEKIKRQFQGTVVYCETIQKSVSKSLEISNNTICCIGSLYMYSDIKKALNNKIL